MTCGVVVLSNRPGDWLEASLRSVVGQADEVVLVDNGSLGGQASSVGRRVGVRVVRSERNLGFAGGVNLGARHLGTDLIALLNDDAVAGAGWLEGAAAALGGGGVAAVTPKVLFAGWYREVFLTDDGWKAPGDDRLLGRRVVSVTVDGLDALEEARGPGIHAVEHDTDGEPARWRWTRPGRPFYVPVPDGSAEVTVNGDVCGGPLRRLVNKAGSLLHADGRLSDRGEGEADDGRWDRAAEHFFASGTAVVVPADTFWRLGGLAEPMFAYYEDVDWSWRARLAGLRILYQPSAVIDHQQSATSGGPQVTWVRRLARANHVLCLVRNAPAPVAVAATRQLLADPGVSGARRRLLAKLPWAISARLGAPHPTVSRNEVWQRWAGAEPVAAGGS